MQKIKLLIAMCFITSIGWAQGITIKGVVSDESGGLPGASLVVKGSESGSIVGTVTDIDGNFLLSVSSDDVLVVSFMGYITQEVPVSGKTTIDIRLASDSENLDELVVIGYGSQKKESVLGAINQIKATEILESGSSNLVNALNGLSPGLSIVQTSGAPGGDDGEIFIRGNSDPLILVDGVEILGGFSNIDPSDVESISTLKDGAATSVYGIRGANGVIIISTKRGKMGKAKVSFKSEFTLKDYIDGEDAMDAYTAKSVWNAGSLNDEVYTTYSSQEALQHWKDGDLPYMYPNTNWSDYMTKDFATSFNQNVSVRGGNKFVTYFASAGYLQEGDIFKTEQLYNYDPEYKFKRYSFRGNLDFKISKTTKLKTSISSRLEDVSKAAEISSLLLYTTDPGEVAPYYPEEVMEQYPDANYPGLVEMRYGAGPNLYKTTNANGMSQTNTTIFSADFELEQKLDFITPGLKFTAKYNYIGEYGSKSTVSLDKTTWARINTFSLAPDGTWTSLDGIQEEAPYEYFIQGGETVNSTSDITYYRGQLNYVRSFGKHNVTGLALFSRNKKVSGVTFPYYTEDWVGRATYNYDAKYFAEVSGSYNGDETFAEGYRFKFFPSFAVGVNLAEQPIVQDLIPTLNNFKVRYSYGQTGSKSGLETNRWQYLSYYDNLAANNGQTRYWFGEDLNVPLTVLAETQIGNPTLSWATVTKQNLGLDFGFYDNKISGSVEFFKDNRDGLIQRLSGTVPIFYGSTADLPYVNIGETESHGYEVMLSYKNTTTDGFGYSATAFYAFNENRVLLSGEDGAGTPSYATVAGKPTGASTLLQDDGYFQSIDEVVNYPSIAGDAALGDYRYIDYNANATVLANDTEDNVRFDLPTAPKNSLSLRLGCSYKGWSLSALVSATVGHEGLVNEDLAYALSSGQASGTYDQLDYWTPTNTSAEYPAIHTSVTNPNLLSSTAMIIDLDYIKLRSMNLAYNFDMRKAKRISSMQLYMSGNNLLTFSHLDYGDPEGNSPGSYPILRRINLGFKMTL